MNMRVTPSWEERNRTALRAALARLAALLRGHPDPGLEEAEGGALARLAAAFGLSPFERDVLLMAAGAELEPDFAALCAKLSGGAAGPCFGLALSLLPGAHWSALAPAGPLRWWRLVEPGPGPLAAAPLRVDEAVLHNLAGVPQLDERLMGLAVPAATGTLPAPSQQAAVEGLVQAWSAERPACLRAPADCGAPAVAEAAARQLGLELYRLRAAEIPPGPAERGALARLWSRQAALDGSALLIAVEEADGPEAERAAADLTARVQGPVALLAADALPVPGARRVELARPDRAEQAALWAAAAPGAEEGLRGRLAAQFDLGPDGIAEAAAGGPDGLWEACRRQTGMRVEGLAERVRPRAGWDDLVLAPPQEAVLREIAEQLRGRAEVLDRWGFRARLRRGLGVAALFAGPSGTGKTLAAEVVANDLGLDLVRIDLSAVVSKYIGETEKNLRRIFDAAEAGSAVLLFDEADALFGKRTEVKDSHDRYANIEVSYLLQRMESYRGLAILTTNMREALDIAFLRRLSFILEFPFPDRPERERLWRGAIPGEAPQEGLDFARLAQLNLPGGHIRNVALAAAYLAAGAGQPIRMAHLLHAARRECAKLERPLTPAETEGWA